MVFTHPGCSPIDSSLCVRTFSRRRSIFVYPSKCRGEETTNQWVSTIQKHVLYILKGFLLEKLKAISHSGYPITDIPYIRSPSVLYTPSLHSTSLDHFPIKISTSKSFSHFFAFLGNPAKQRLPEVILEGKFSRRVSRMWLLACQVVAKIM